MSNAKYLDLEGLKHVLSNMKTKFPQLKADNRLEGSNEFAKIVTVTGLKNSAQTQDETNVWNTSGGITNLAAYALKEELGDLAKMNKKELFHNPGFTGIPYVSVGEGPVQRGVQLATVNDVNNAIGATQSQALIFKGAIGTNPATLPDNPKVGDTYVVDQAGTYAGELCEVGDTIICKTAKTASAVATWLVVQKNIDGAVTTTETLTANQVLLGNGNKTVKPLPNGTAGQVLKIREDGVPMWGNDNCVLMKPYLSNGNQIFPLVFGKNAGFNNSGFAIEGVGHVYTTNSMIKVNPGAGILYANDFKGLLNGHKVEADVPANAKFTDTWRPLGSTQDSACAGNDARLNTGANVRVNGNALGNVSKNINTNSFYIIDDITTEDFPGGSTANNVSHTIYCKGYLLGSLNGSPINNYPNKEQFGIVEKVNDTTSLPKAPINALYFNTKDGLLYYNTGTELRKIFDDINEASQFGATLGLLSISDYDTIMNVVDGAPTEAITSAEIDQLFA